MGYLKLILIVSLVMILAMDVDSAPRRRSNRSKHLSKPSRFSGLSKASKIASKFLGKKASSNRGDQKVPSRNQHSEKRIPQRSSRRGRQGSSRQGRHRYSGRGRHGSSGRGHHGSSGQSKHSSSGKGRRTQKNRNSPFSLSLNNVWPNILNAFPKPAEKPAPPPAIKPAIKPAIMPTYEIALPAVEEEQAMVITSEGGIPRWAMHYKK